MAILLIVLWVWAMMFFYFSLELLQMMPWRSCWWHFFLCAATLWYGFYWWALFFGLVGGVIWCGDPERVQEREANMREKQMKEYMAARRAELEERRRERGFAMWQINQARHKERAEAQLMRQRRITALKDERRELEMQVNGINKAVHQLLATADNNPKILRDVQKLNNQIVDLQIRREKISGQIAGFATPK